eukprot:SAG31_NODE_12553_length_933_cov_0.776978_1_plen_106_part_00
MPCGCYSSEIRGGTASGSEPGLIAMQLGQSRCDALRPSSSAAARSALLHCCLELCRCRQIGRRAKAVIRANAAADRRAAAARPGAKVDDGKSRFAQPRVHTAASS